MHFIGTSNKMKGMIRVNSCMLKERFLINNVNFMKPYSNGKLPQQCRFTEFRYLLVSGLRSWAPSLIISPLALSRRGFSSPANSTGKPESSTTTCPYPTISLPKYIGSSTSYNHRTGTKHILEFEKQSLTHVIPARISDHLAIFFVKLLRWLGDKVVRNRYLHRATMLKVVASSPAFAGAVYRYMRGIIYCEYDQTDILRILLSEAENHHRHLEFLMIIGETKPRGLERAAILMLQFLHFSLFLVFFIVSPRFSHRLMGYIGEESCVLWTHMINDIDCGKVPDIVGKLPKECFYYWDLTPQEEERVNDEEYLKTNSSNDGDKTEPDTHENAHSKNTNANDVGEGDEKLLPIGNSMRDLILLIRADEMNHRDQNHKLADYYESRKTKEAVQ